MSLSTISNNYFSIRFGEYRTPRIPFNKYIDFGQIQKYVKEWLEEKLPTTYHIEFYSWKAKKFIVLDENVLRYEYNPFLLDLRQNDQIIDAISDDVALFIVDDSDSNSKVNEPIENPSCDILALHCDNDKDDALLDQFDLNKFEDVSKNNIAISDFQDDNDNYLSEETLLEILGSPLYDYLNSAQILNDKSCQIALSSEQNNQLTRPHFSHDVKTYQKNNYLTNVFPLGQESIDKSIVSNTKKGISCVQGIKKQENERLQVLPKIKGLQQFQNEPDTDLYIYGVHEELKDNYCIWYEHADKKFLLFDELKPNAIPNNPIKFSLNEITFTKDGEFELEIYMLTKWEKNKNELKLHQLDETSTRHLRSAIHQTQTTKTHMPPVRLLGVLKRANSFDWNNFFLSDFIQPPPGNASKRSSSSVDLTDTYEPKPKKTESTQTYFTIN
ncbi:unnamed protein product [Rotaria sordida]|uniref:Uncharacterized protein n=1 Tax=Rotaria sordida TaxID=392033 RepID=A0A813NJM7_9BILA|nr:unnamed protein product [Rotaria sordida]CAF1177899.1 unnamed protein product [Rotaria sordida]